MAAVFRASRQLFMAAAKSRAAPKTNPPRMAKSKTRPEASIEPKRLGILEPKPVSPQLEKFCGAPEISRSLAVKKIWDYVKENNLQNPSNKKEIICDDKLKTIFAGKDTIGFLEIGKLLSAHFVKNK